MSAVDTLGGVLAWIVGPDGGAFLVIAAVTAWLLEGVGWWTDLARKTKSTVILILAIVLGLGAQWLQNNPELVQLIDPYFQTVLKIFLAWGVTQVAHFKNPKRLENQLEKRSARPRNPVG